MATHLEEELRGEEAKRQGEGVHSGDSGNGSRGSTGKELGESQDLERGEKRGVRRSDSLVYWILNLGSTDAWADFTESENLDGKDILTIAFQHNWFPLYFIMYM